jgi:hypothetical protein
MLLAAREPIHSRHAATTTGSIRHAMLWIYERFHQTLQVQTRFDHANKEYVLIVRPLGEREVERFSDVASFQARLRTLERQLDSELWKTRSAVTIRDGWKL